MKSDLWRRLFDRIGRRHDTAGDPDFAEEIIKTTRAHIAKDFPNPEREGCPARGAVFNSFRSGKIPSGEDRAHILSCSECFNEYQIQLAEYRTANRVSESAGRLSWWPRVAIPGLAVLLAAIAITVWKFSPRQQVDDNVASHTNGAIASPSLLPSPSATQIVDDSQKSANSLIAVNNVTIDFEQATALRRQAPQQSKPISLSPTPHALLIKLPDQSPRGAYTVTLNDAFGKSVRSKTATSASGKTVKVVFNLTGLNSGGYSICVTREQEVPSCLPLTIRTR